MWAPPENTGEPRRYKIKLILSVFVMIWVIMGLFVVGLVLNPPLNFSCFSCPILGVYTVSFGSAPGQVTFTINNSGSQDQTIAQVVTGQSKYSYNATVSTNTVVHPGTNSSLTVTFPNTMFLVGKTYNFTFITLLGAWFPISAVR